MKIMEALAKENLMLVNGRRWLVMRNGAFIVFEHRLRKVTDTRLYHGEDEETALRFLLEGSGTAESQEEA